MKNVIILSCILLLQCSSKASAQIEKFKAAYVFSFCQQMKWPENQNSGDFIIGVLEQDQALANELKATTANRAVGNQPIKIEVYKNADEIKQCHILYVSGNQSIILRKAIIKLGNYPTVVITENPNQTPVESTINLFIENDKLAFAFNRDNAVLKKVTVSDKLLSLSKKQS
jgi:hypothetical protein